MVHLPKLPDPDNVFSAIDKASGVIDKGLGFIDKVSDKLDWLGISDESIPPAEAPARTPLPYTSEESPEALRVKLRRVSSGSGVSTEQTIAYQNRELGKELLLLEKHLSQGCRIPPITGKPCDCCSPKHTTTIEALAIETYGITANPLHQEIAAWASELAARTTIPEIESGSHNYGEDAIQAREYRKQILGSESLDAMISP